MKLHTNYQSPGPLTPSDKKIFKVFTSVYLCKTSDPWSGAIFLLQGYNFKNLEESLLDEATYQISKAWAF